MLNEICCKCDGNTINRAVNMNITCSQTPSISNLAVQEGPVPCQYYVGIFDTIHMYTTYTNIYIYTHTHILTYTHLSSK
jgi:hypothetical protein